MDGILQNYTCFSYVHWNVKFTQVWKVECCFLFRYSLPPHEKYTFLDLMKTKEYNYMNLFTTDHSSTKVQYSQWSLWRVICASCRPKSVVKPVVVSGIKMKHRTRNSRGEGSRVESMFKQTSDDWKASSSVRLQRYGLCSVAGEIADTNV